MLARCGDAVAAHVLFLRPGGSATDWEKTDLWCAASAIPGVRVYADEAGVEAARFGAATSGHAVLYDSTGTLAFSGGITVSRGHEGDNPGRDAVTSLLTRGRGGQPRTPVFGCPLFNPQPPSAESPRPCIASKPARQRET